MFWLIEPSSGQIQNIVLAHSVSPYTLTECTGTMLCIWPDDGSKKPKHVAEILILITNTIFPSP